jgi:hypothetical protein
MAISSPFSGFDLVAPHDSYGMTHQFPWLVNYAYMRFSSITIDELRELAHLSIDGYKIPDMWQGRASFMFGCVAKCLIQLRDEYDVKINYHTLSHSVSYSGISELYQDDRLNPESREAISKYIQDTPGAFGSNRSMELHGYLSMQFSSWLATMAAVSKLSFINSARNLVLTNDGIIKIISENNSSKFINSLELIKWLVEMGADSSVVALKSTLTHRRGMLEYEMGV